MTEPIENLAESLSRCLSTVRDLAAAAWPLRDQSEAAAGLLADALRDPSRRRYALLLVSFLDTDLTIQLIDVIVSLAAGDKDAIACREIVGRLPYREALARVPPVVDRLLDDADDHEYRRYAELLAHLGLTQSLHELCVRASNSDDAGIREVAEEFS